MTPDPKASPLDATRRRFLAVSTAAGLGGTLLPGALLALATQSTPAAAQQRAAAKDDSGFPPITVEMIEQAAAISGLKFTEDQRKIMIDGLVSTRDAIVTVRKLALPNSVAPSLVFDPVPPGAKLETEKKPIKLGPAPSVVGLFLSEEEKLAFSTVRQLSELLRAKKVSSTELTKTVNSPDRPRAVRKKWLFGLPRCRRLGCTPQGIGLSCGAWASRALSRPFHQAAPSHASPAQRSLPPSSKSPFQPWRRCRP